jgi:glycosyltransferase involved in cell wall biosynthesis
MNSDLPLITIGIPCFNAQRHLDACIQSSLAIDWPRLEIIAVDDGSSDETPAILERYKDRIRLFKQDHRGACAARNLILKEARGEWIQYLDADDYLQPAKLKKQWEEGREGVMEGRADLLYSPVWLEEWHNGQPLPLRPNPINVDLDLCSQWILWQLPQTGAALWNTRVLRELGGWNESMPCCQEHELYLRAIQNGVRFFFTPTSHAVYRIWSEDTLCRRDPRLLVHTKTDLIRACRDWMQLKGLWTPRHARLAGRVCFELSRTLARYDLDEAVAYYNARKGEGLIHLSGPAAPLSYRLAHACLGFRLSERLAQRMRRRVDGEWHVLNIL